MLFICIFHLLYPPGLTSLDSKISRGRAHIYRLIWCQKQQKIRTWGGLLNAVWKLIEKKVNLIQGKMGMRKRSYIVPLGLLWFPHVNSSTERSQHVSPSTEITFYISQALCCLLRGCLHTWSHLILTTRYPERQAEVPSQVASGEDKT